MKLATVVTLLFSLACTTLNAQEKPTIITLSFKKGEVLDIILASSAPDAKALIDHYRKTAFPIAFEYSYQSQPGFDITKLILGNYLPQFMVFGKWDSRAQREGFLSNITKRLPDFHEQRKAIFTAFNLTYYVLAQDLEFEVDTDKYNVTATFWQKDKKSFKAFIRQWKREVTASGGKILVQLEKGTSPVGYMYNPDLFCIARWDDQSAFEAFAKDHPLDSHEALANVHQFAIAK